MVNDQMDIPRPAPLMRTFGWSMLALLATYLINNYLFVAKGWPGMAALLSGEFNLQSVIMLAIYAAGFALAILYVMRSRATSLRTDAARVTRFNTWLIRGFFWAVLFVGLADMAISFLRVEGLLGHFFSEDMIKQLGRSQWRGAYVHWPLIGLGMFLALFTRTIGFHWLALLIVVAELVIVFTRFIFSYEQAFMGDLVRFWYAALFLFASAYTLLEEGHVRVDVLYANLSSTARGAVNAFGAILLGMSLCWTIIIIGTRGKASIIYGPLSNFEVSQSGFGMYTKYLMAGFLGVFAITMLIQFVSQMFESYADYRDEPGGREIESDEDYLVDTSIADLDPNLNDSSPVTGGQSR
ncbi:MAG: TRAP transporter small permease subunit [Gammaproteobacteria bacterium]|nr:TRAP transporter small permease subunit [Gammaproteobacteria bacterium]